MKVLIIEDEYPAVERLQKLLHKLDEPITVAAIQDSVEGAISWLQQQPAPDLILSDIQLSDGLSFEIFEKVLVHSPVIFTTSYDEYAIRAFQVKSVDYLLKPVKLEALRAAIDKYKSMKETFSGNRHAEKLEQLLDSLQHSGKSYKKRFLVKKGEQLIPVEDEQVAYFHAENELVFLYTPEGRKYLVDYTLEQVDDLLNSARFFRINRQYILHIQSIREIHTYFNSRLKLYLKPEATEDVLVSKSKVRDFKTWLEG